jgi:plastocyanin
VEDVTSLRLQRRRWSLLIALLLLVGLIVAAGGTSEASVRLFVAGPSAALTGYLTPVVYVPRGTTATFRNLDSLARHDVLAQKAGTCRGKAFCTPIKDPNQTATVKGVQKLKPGTYPFFCSLHTFMRGQLVVR